jgi:hypothetical protein
MKKRQVFFILSLIIAIAGTAVSYATTSETTGITVLAGSSSSVLAASHNETTPDIADGNNYGDNPSWSPVANSTGSIGAGDLYIINLPTGEDRRLTLYLNNPEKLSKAYSYLNMNITVYEANDNANPTSWLNPKNAYLSLTNGYISFDLTGGKKYSISVDGGSFYCMTTDETLAPSFFAELR